MANVGGYVGLFLGYAILQTPLFLLNMYRMVKRFATRIMRSSKPKSNSSIKITSSRGKGVERINLNENIHALKETIGKLITRIEDAEDIVNSLKQEIRSVNNKLYVLQS